MTRIVIADDHPLFRGALRQAVSHALAGSEVSEVGSLEALGQALAEAACRAPAQPVTRLPLMAAAERAQLIDGFNRTAVAHAHVPSLQALVEQQVARRPGQVAAVFDDVSFSYAELDRRANRLARHLRTLGVQPDDRVAVCIDRVGAMLVALLATLKAGAA